MRENTLSKQSRTGSRSRARWIVPALLMIGWLVIGGVAGPFAGKLGNVQSNDSSTFLPASAESTQVSNLLKKFSTSSLIPAVIIAENSSGISEADLAFLTEVTQKFPKIEGVGPEVSPPIASQDGKAAQVIVGVDTARDPGVTVTKMRDALGAKDAPSDLRILVSGPAGQIADLTSAFGGIDGLLLLVTGLVVAVILIVVYRSPLLPVLVLLSAVFALSVASLGIYLLAKNNVLALNGQSQGILFILVFGAATDYSLLLVSRFREELRNVDSKYDAIRRAWRATLEPVAASAGTVILGVLCLLFSDLNSNRGLGPVAAIGIAASFLASMTFLPAALALVGRAAFWPVRPRHLEAANTEKGFWWGLSNKITAHPRRYWVATALVLLAFAAFLPQFKSSGVAQSKIFLNPAESVAGQEVIAKHFPGGSGSPTIIVARADSAQKVVSAVESVKGVSPGVTVVGASGMPGGPPKVVDGRVQIQATLTDAADSESAVDTVRRIRVAVHDVSGADALVGGPTATQLDTQATSERDRAVIIPIVLLVVFLVLALLLRALVAPLLLIATVVLSFAATLGVSALVFDHIFNFPGSDPVVPLFGFVFLVALGVDYNIFLMSRVREESIAHGTREGMRRGLAVTGGVISSAGVVLAATFAALSVIPLLFLAQIAFIVAFGVLLDALIVRSLLVPSLVLEIDRRIWWPSRLARTPNELVSTDSSAG